MKSQREVLYNFKLPLNFPLKTNSVNISLSFDVKYR
jgi:hypothetical protein